jgi:hypothetical protein
MGKVATYTYAWGNNERRLTLKGRKCRVLAQGAKGSVMVQFENGQKEVVSRRALRKGKTWAEQKKPVEQWDWQ